MAKEGSSKSSSKALPGLIFLIGLALIVGGVLMQIGYFGDSGNAVPEETNTEATSEEVANNGESEPPVEDEGTADAGNVDFSITNITDNIPIPVKIGVNYTYAEAFAMIVSDMEIKCDESDCGKEGSKVSLRFSTTDGRDYTLDLTPEQATANLIDVPVTVQEWHKDYVVIQTTR